MLFVHSCLCCSNTLTSCLIVRACLRCFSIIYSLNSKKNILAVILMLLRHLPIQKVIFETALPSIAKEQTFQLNVMKFKSFIILKTSALRRRNLLNKQSQNFSTFKTFSILWKLKALQILRCFMSLSCNRSDRFHDINWVWNLFSLNRKIMNA